MNSKTSSIVPRFLIGEHVYLRPLDAGDLAYIQKWTNDPEIRGLIGEVRPMSRAKAEAFYERVKSDEHRVWFIVALKEDDRVIGEAGLLRMFPAWRTTDLSIIIGERDAWGQGYGTDAINLLLDYAFGYLTSIAWQWAWSVSTSRRCGSMRRWGSEGKASRETAITMATSTMTL